MVNFDMAFDIVFDSEKAQSLQGVPSGCKQKLRDSLYSIYTLRRPVMREVLSTRIWGVPPAGGLLL